MLCSNIFGDIISDECATITGSMGMLPSQAETKATLFRQYEPGGRQRVLQISQARTSQPSRTNLLAALMLRYSLAKKRQHKILKQRYLKASKELTADQQATNKR
ncbi:isocitrate/isopropylmalate family dehydrogenase [Vibrio chagasii]|nr:isocitrate/isopropylmalate family dehydrogenase [Vibrio chagasii]